MLISSACAEGATLRTMSCFAGDDAAAVSYVELLRAYEEQTGNVVEDNSATSDEGWKARVLSEFAVGNQPDVLFFFAHSAGFGGAAGEPGASGGRCGGADGLQRRGPLLQELQALRGHDAGGIPG